MMAKPKLTKSATPKPKPASKPATKAVSKPTSKSAPTPKPASKPAAKSAAKPAAKVGQRPASKAVSIASNRPTGGARTTAQKPAKGKAGGRGSSKKPQPKAKSEKASGSASGRVESSDQLQQEIEALRGQVGALAVQGLWTKATAPKVSGTFGLLLQNLDAGVNLRDAFAKLNTAAADIRNNSAKVLTLVKNHKTPTFTTRKKK